MVKLIKINKIKTSQYERLQKYLSFIKADRISKAKFP